MNIGKNNKFSTKNDKGGVSCFNLLKCNWKDVKIPIQDKNNFNNNIIENKYEEDSVDSETSQLSNLTNVEIHENQYHKFNFRENIFLNSSFQETLMILKNDFLQSSKKKRNLFSTLRENYSFLQKITLELKEKCVIKENKERNLSSLSKDLKFLEKKYNNLKYEGNIFSPNQKDKKDSNKINYFELECQNYNNNLNVSDSFNRSSNVSNMSSFFNNPNLHFNNEMNVDELIDELENKLSFIKLQNAQTMERLDYLCDEIVINEKLNKVIFLSMYF